MKNKTTALILSILLGGLGVDRFYLGYTNMGILKLLTGGCFGILWIIDIVKIATDELLPADGSQYDDIPSKTSNSIPTVYDDLLKISVLKEKGIISEEEYEKMKSDCMKNITHVSKQIEVKEKPTAPLGKINFKCKSCGAVLPDWYQQCPVCNANGQMYRGSDADIAELKLLSRTLNNKY